jgi:large subunit ribosomal protein L5
VAPAEAPRAKGTGEVPARLKVRFQQSIAPALMKERGYTNPWQVPRLHKIVVSMGVGEGRENAKVLDFATADLQSITGQRPVVTRAKKSIANFKLREGVPIGTKVTLRGARMYEFRIGWSAWPCPASATSGGCRPGGLTGAATTPWGCASS